MSTIYTIDRETAIDSLATGDLFLVYDTSAKAIKNATGTNVQDLVTGSTTASTVGFYGATKVGQPASSNQAAPSATAATSTSPYGFTTSTQADALITCVRQLRADLVTLGLIKGSA